MNGTTPKYEVIENNLKQAILSHEMTGKIPGERVLAKEYGVSYMTLRKAVDNLVAENYLYRVPARGTYVTHTTALRSMVRNIGRFFEGRTV